MNSGILNKNTPLKAGMTMLEKYKSTAKGGRGITTVWALPYCGSRKREAKKKGAEKGAEKGSKEKGSKEKGKQRKKGAKKKGAKEKGSKEKGSKEKGSKEKGSKGKREQTKSQHEYRLYIRRSTFDCATYHAQQKHDDGHHDRDDDGKNDVDDGVKPKIVQHLDETEGFQDKTKLVLRQGGSGRVCQDRFFPIDVTNGDFGNGFKGLGHLKIFHFENHGFRVVVCPTGVVDREVGWLLLRQWFDLANMEEKKKV